MQLGNLCNNGTTLCNNGMETISHNQCKKTYCGISGRINFFLSGKVELPNFSKNFLFAHNKI